MTLRPEGSDGCFKAPLYAPFRATAMHFRRESPSEHFLARFWRVISGGMPRVKQEIRANLEEIPGSPPRVKSFPFIPYPAASGADPLRHARSAGENIIQRWTVILLYREDSFERAYGASRGLR